MAFQVSPGVQVSEIDLTNVVPAVSSTVGGFAGTFQWGPVDEVVTVSDAKSLVDIFYEPANTDASAEDFYSAESFLKYGSALRVIRLNNSGLYNSNSSGGTQLIKNDTDYQNIARDGSLSGTTGQWTARFAGALGNSLKVSVCPSANAYFNAGVGAVAGNEAQGNTSISVGSGEGASFNVRDIIEFDQVGHNTQYRITAIATDSLTIEAIGQPTGTGLTVAVSAATNVNRYWEFYNIFNKAPAKSASALSAGGSDDEIHVVVVDEDGTISGTANTVLESYPFVSLASDSKDSNGNSNYYRDVIERDSQWVYWTAHTTSTHTTVNEHRTHVQSATTAFGRPSAVNNSSLSAGSDGTEPTAGVIYGAWQDHFEDASASDISFLIVGSTRTDNGDSLADWTTIINQGIQLCETRKDCILVASPMKKDVLGTANSEANHFAPTSENNRLKNVIATVDTATSSSYVVFDSTWVYQYDRFNDRYCYIPANPHTAGIMARSDLLRDPWYSPAGFSRGQYLGITKLAFNPRKSSRDDLYRARVNPVVTFAGQGTVLFGDKTGLSTTSAFDRINVRRLFIVLEKAIATAAQAQLFEFNDAFTRAQFRSAVEPFLRDVKNRRGLVDFSVVCDETNNTDSVIDRNEFVCSIFIKPAKSINFVTLNFVATRSGVEFEEVYGAV
jgi:phage tail sheath protein FI